MRITNSTSNLNLKINIIRKSKEQEKRTRKNTENITLGQIFVIFLFSLSYSSNILYFVLKFTNLLKKSKNILFKQYYLCFSNCYFI